jgi:hypothetical protein
MIGLLRRDCRSRQFSTSVTLRRPDGRSFPQKTGDRLDRIENLSLWHLGDMPTGFDDVRCCGKIGSGRPSDKTTLMTRSGSCCRL